MTPRLRDIARHAGVSEATVSRVVNNKPGVNETTRRNVLAAIAEFRYESAGLRRADRAGLVGLLIPELGNPIFPAFAQVFTGLLAAQRFTTVLCTATVDGVSEEEYVDMLLDHGLSGLIVVSGKNADTTADHSLYRGLAGRRLPMVFLNGSVTDVDSPVVSTDDAHAANIAVRHLAGLGHEAIGCAVGSSRYVPVQRRLQGYHQAMHELGLVPMVCESEFTVEGGEAASHQLLDRGVTAIITASDLMALGAIRAAGERGLRVPADVSVVGYDDNMLLNFTDPALTSVRQPLSAMCTAAVSALIDQINGVQRPTHELVFRGELIVRASTALRRGSWVQPSNQMLRTTEPISK
ncbi:MAG: LacI family DNA-binding transcriptional regulator [Actinomycetota bacterium]|nr:LacI family DNA-binding transcriptional regulator [Actinomycetota bacterium]